MRTILVVATTDLARDPRVYRQILFLKDKFKVLAMGQASPGISGVEFFKLPAPSGSKIIRNARRLTSLLGRRYSSIAAREARHLLDIGSLPRDPVDLVITNDVETLPLGRALAEHYQAKLLLDAHEMEPWNRRQGWQKRVQEGYWRWMCKAHIPGVDGMTSVCDGIAHHYHKTYGVECAVVTNAPFHEPQSPQPLSSRQIRLVHHGVTNPSRSLESMMTLMDLLDERFTLDLMLVRNHEHVYQRLKKMAANRPGITFRDPVPMPEIARALNHYDIGIFLLPPVSLNQRLALPNKLFEFIQGRLAVGIWPSPEMARIVEEHRLGVVSEDFSVSSLAARLNVLNTTDVERFKANADTAASKLCAEANKINLLGLVECLLHQKCLA